MRITTGLIAALALVSGSAIAAEDTGFYVGASVGQGSFSLNTNKVNNAIEGAFNDNNLALDATGQNKDTKSTTWQAILGYRLNPYLAGEITYLDLRGPSYKLNGDATFPPTFIAPVPVSTKADWSASGVPISVLGIWPITDEWEIFGRVGVFMGDVKVKVAVNADNGNANARARESDGSTEFIGGAGVNYNFMDVWTARAEWQGMPSVGNNQTGSTSWNQIALSVLYKF